MIAPTPNKPSEVRIWCEKNGFHPNRTLGQNFLIDKNAIDDIVAAAEVSAGEKILEVGPGLGAITRAMLAKGAIVSAVEKDNALATCLKSDITGPFTIYAQDMLDVPLENLLSTGTITENTITTEPYFTKFVSNLPYSVGTRILLDIAKSPLSPQILVVMVQKEVADRILAKPSTPERGLVGVWIERSCDVEIVRTVKPTCFWPKPEISSSVIKLIRHNRHPLTPQELQVFETITRLAFSHRRKQLTAIFRKQSPYQILLGNGTETWLKEAGIPPQTRPETLTTEEWCRLSRNLTQRLQV